jgi:hypothetical protein
MSASVTRRILRLTRAGLLSEYCLAVVIESEKAGEVAEALQAAVSRARINGADTLADRLAPWATIEAAGAVAERYRLLSRGAA